MLEVLVDLQKLKFLSLQLLIDLFPVRLVGMNRVSMLNWLRVLMVVMVFYLCTLVRMWRLLFLLRMGVVVMDMNEGVLQSLEPPEVLVSLGFPVSSLGTILVQNAIKGRSTHFNNLNQTKLIAWDFPNFLYLWNITIGRFIFCLSLLKSLIINASDDPPFPFAHFFYAPFELAYSPTSPNISDLPSYSSFSL